MTSCPAQSRHAKDYLKRNPHSIVSINLDAYDSINQVARSEPAPISMIVERLIDQFLW